MLPGALAHRQGLLEVDFFRLEGVKHQVGGHQLGQRSGLDRDIDVLGGQHLVGRDVHQQVAAGSDFGRLRGRRRLRRCSEGVQGTSVANSRRAFNRFFMGAGKEVRPFRRGSNFSPISRAGGAPPDFSTRAIVRERSARPRAQRSRAATEGRAQSITAASGTVSSAARRAPPSVRSCSLGWQAGARQSAMASGAHQHNACRAARCGHSAAIRCATGGEGAKRKARKRKRRPGATAPARPAGRLASPTPCFVVHTWLAPTPRKLKRTAVQPHCTKARASVCTTLLSMVPANSGCGWAMTATPCPFCGCVTRRLIAQRLQSHAGSRRAASIFQL